VKVGLQTTGFCLAEYDRRLDYHSQIVTGPDGTVLAATGELPPGLPDARPEMVGLPDVRRGEAVSTRYPVVQSISESTGSVGDQVLAKLRVWTTAELESDR
jgi:hypothetical protein